jgi:hypothetical protein
MIVARVADGSKDSRVRLPRSFVLPPFFAACVALAARQTAPRPLQRGFPGRRLCQPCQPIRRAYAGALRTKWVLRAGERQSPRRTRERAGTAPDLRVCQRAPLTKVTAKEKLASGVKTQGRHLALTAALRAPPFTAQLFLAPPATAPPHSPRQSRPAIPKPPHSLSAGESATTASESRSGASLKAACEVA